MVVAVVICGMVTACYHREKDNLWLTSSQMDGAGVAVVRPYLVRFGDRSALPLGSFTLGCIEVKADEEIKDSKD